MNDREREAYLNRIGYEGELLWRVAVCEACIQPV